MDEKAFSLKCEAQSVKVQYDREEHISVIKVYPEQKSDIKIVFGRHSMTINDSKPRSRQKNDYRGCCLCRICIILSQKIRNLSILTIAFLVNSEYYMNDVQDENNKLANSLIYRR